MYSLRRTLSQVDGSLSTWLYIFSDVYPLHDSPALDLASVYELLPVVHKYVRFHSLVIY
jgi:hypothetical protein